MLNFIKQKRYIVTMATWIFLVIAYILGNVLMPSNVKYLPYVTDLFYVAVILIIYEPFVYYWMKLWKNGINILEIIGAILFVMISTIFLGIFFLSTYKGIKLDKGLFYYREEIFLHDKITIYKMDNIILMKQIDNYYIERYEDKD